MPTIYQAVVQDRFFTTLLQRNYPVLASIATARISGIVVKGRTVQSDVAKQKFVNGEQAALFLLAKDRQSMLDGLTLTGTVAGARLDGHLKVWAGSFGEMEMGATKLGAVTAGIGDSIKGAAVKAGGNTFKRFIALKINYHSGDSTKERLAAQKSWSSTTNGYYVIIVDSDLSNVLGDIMVRPQTSQNQLSAIGGLIATHQEGRRGRSIAVSEGSNNNNANN